MIIKMNTLAAKITFIILSVILVNTIAIVFISLLTHHNDAMESGAEMAIAIATATAASIDPDELRYATNENHKNEHYEHLQKQFNRIKAEENLLYFYTGIFDENVGLITYLEAVLPGEDFRFNLNGVVPITIFPQEAFDAFNNGRAYATEIYRLNIDNSWGLAAYAPVFDENQEPIGLVGVVRSFEELLYHSKKFAFTMVGISFLIFAVIIWIPILYVRRFVAKPLHSLQTVSDKIINGDMNAHIPISNTSDEIGILSQKFNTMMRNINRQNELLNALNQASAILLEPDIAHIEDRFRSVMSIMAKVVDVDHITIWRNGFKNKEMCSSLIYKWPENSGVDKNDSSLQNIPYLGTRWEEILSNNDCINSVVCNLPPQEQKVLKSNGIISIFISPVFVNNKFWGYVGFDDCRNERIFAKNEEVIMRSVGRIIANAFIRNEMSENLTAAKKQSRAKTTFLAKMSHEIRTPMNAIIGMAELALRKDISSIVREEIVTIKRAGTNLLSIINSILDFSKIESGKLVITPKKYQLSSLIHDVTSVIRAKLVGSKVRFDLKIDSKMPNVLFGDETKIRQIFLNILDNAIKYTNEGFIAFSLNGKISDNMIVLTADITDSGRGIKKEDVEKLFGDFVQVDVIANQGIEGTGLGLAIVKNLTEAMGGSIKVESEYGKGSTFAIKLPQKILSHEPIAAFEIQEDNFDFEIKFNAPKARILVVDDITTNLKVAEGLLSFYKMQVDTALSAIEAIDKIAKAAQLDSHYNLVFMDHMMPEMDGVEATKLIKKQGHDLPIIALTANAISGAKKMFLANGFSDFLSKPIDIVKLDAILEKWVPKDMQEQAKGIIKNEISEQMLAIFYNDGITKIEEIKKCLETENYPLYIIHVHALKSALANIGAKELSESAKALETGDLGFIKANTAVFLAKLKLLLDSINKSFTGRRKEESPSYEVLIGLKEALQTMDVSVINNAVNDLHNFAQADGILENVLIGNYDGAVAMIDDLLSKKPIP